MSATKIEVWQEEDGRYVVVDEETGLRAKAEMKATALQALAQKLSGNHELAERMSQAESIEEVTLALATDERFTKAVEVMNTLAEADDIETAVGEGPEPDSIRGVIADSTDKSASELVQESRSRDEQRLERLSARPE